VDEVGVVTMGSGVEMARERLWAAGRSEVGGGQHGGQSIRSVRCGRSDGDCWRLLWSTPAHTTFAQGHVSNHHTPKRCGGGTDPRRGRALQEHPAGRRCPVLRHRSPPKRGPVWPAQEARTPRPLALQPARDLHMRHRVSNGARREEETGGGGRGDVLLGGGGTKTKRARGQELEIVAIKAEALGRRFSAPTAAADLPRRPGAVVISETV
jgi:hypothetical protein